MTSVLTGEQLVNARIKSERELPVIGPKEFQPSNTWLQNRQIQSALFERKVLLEEERVEKWGSLSTAVWRPAACKAEVIRKTGKHWDVFGHHKDNADWLYPEEALFLMEMNCLELLFEDVPMSIQRGYTVLISARNGCLLNEYRVFLHLSRQGYRVFRHDPDLTVTAYEKQIRLDQYVLHQKRLKQKTCVQSNEIVVSDNEQIVSDEGVTENIDSDKECDVIEVPKEKNVQVIQIDESDDEIIEVVYERNVKVESDDDSEESEQDSESDSDSSNNSGNWKRQSVTGMEREQIFPKPAARVNYVTINEFLFDLDLARKSSNRNKNFGKAQNVDEELTRFYNEIEVIDLGSDQEDDRLVIKKDRRDILDSMCLQKDSEGNIVIVRPEEHFLPPGVRPKFPLYRINLDSIRSETQRRVTTNQQRWNRGRYNPNFNRRRFTNPWTPFANNNYRTLNDFRNGQIIQLQTMARNMMEMASTVLLNTMAPQCQSNWQMNYQNRSVQPQNFQQNYNATPPLIYDYHKNNTQFQNSNYSAPVNNFQRNDNFQRNNNFQRNDNFRRNYNFQRNGQGILGQHPLEAVGSAVQKYYPNESRNDVFSDNNNYFGRNRHRTYFQESGLNSPNQSARITEFNESFPDTEMRSEITLASDIQSDSVSVRSSADESRHDPAYTCPDIPATDDFIPLGGPVRRNENNRVHIVDVNNLSNDDDVVIVEEEVLKNGYKKSGKKRQNPNQRYFCLPKKKFKKEKPRKFRSQFTRHVEVINLEDNSDVSVEEEKQNLTVGIKTENVKSSSSCIKTEKSNDVSAPLIAPTDQIKTENNVDKVKAEKDEVTVPVPIKKEVTVNGTGTVKHEKIDSDEISNDVFSMVSSLVNRIEMDGSTTSVKTEIPEANSTALTEQRECEFDNVVNVTIKVEAEIKTEEDSEKETSVENNLNNIIKIEKHNEIESDKQVETNDNLQMDINESEKEVEDSRKCENETNMIVANEEADKETKSADNDEIMEVENIVTANTDVNGDKVSENTKTIENGNSLGEGVTEEHGENDNEEISNWADLKRTVSTFVQLEREESNIEDEIDENDVQPLLKPKHCQTLGSVLSALQIFQPASPDVPEEEQLKIMFDMYLPSTTFRKSAPGLPAYRIVVIGHSSPVPSSAQITELKKRFKDETPVLLAVVMPDSIAYYIMAPIELPTQQCDV